MFLLLAHPKTSFVLFVLILSPPSGDVQNSHSLRLCQWLIFVLLQECQKSPCQNGGQCITNVASFTCNCPPGFTGDRCEKKSNGCQHDSCSNGGTCSETSYGFKCSCVPGFSGSRCDVNMNDCANSPCKNNGMCVDQVGGYKCLCKPGYSGSTCEIGKIF